MDLNSYKEDLIDGVNDFIHKYQERPFSFLTESDLQCALYACMVNRITPYPPIRTQKRDIDLIHAEYMKVPRSQSRVDLVPRLRGVRRVVPEFPSSLGCREFPANRSTLLVDSLVPGVHLNLQTPSVWEALFA